MTIAKQSRVGLKRMSATAKLVTIGNNPVRVGNAIRSHRKVTMVIFLNQVPKNLSYTEKFFGI